MLLYQRRARLADISDINRHIQDSAFRNRARRHIRNVALPAATISQKHLVQIEPLEIDPLHSPISDPGLRQTTASYSG